MRGTHRYAAWLGLVLCGLEGVAANAQQPTPVKPPQWPVAGAGQEQTPVPVMRPQPRATDVPLDSVPARLREAVRSVVEHPTLAAGGPAEEFTGQLAVYRWLLDHPDRTARSWRQLGAPCLDITQRGEGRFGWGDAHGSDVRWDTVFRDGTRQIWYAEGAVKPGPLVPLMPVRAVVVMHYGEHVDPLGRSTLWHQADLFVQTDSKAAAVALRLFGSSVPRLTEQCLGQLEMFFSAMTNYIQRHPEKTAMLLK
ncbi:hypothetical protein AYO44_02270 [Planctomycetaceae bacterium SCGC AG-212-F19]|nr:hypothetical protein AYO44_02270 [Planctomycetaceae bacterium SCGC AG-212-F19]